MRTAMRGVAAGLVGVLFVGGCVSRGVPPLGIGGKASTPATDEQALWARAEKEEAALRTRTTTYDDPPLEAYLATIVRRLLPDSARAAGGPQFEVTVLRDATLGAFAMPDGRIYVHTGLLSRIESEAQLATILAREMAHVIRRHALRFDRAARRTRLLGAVAAVTATLGVAGAASLPPDAGPVHGDAALSPTASAILGLGLTLATIAAISGYGTGLEREADRDGLDRLVQAGWDPSEAPKVFATLLAGLGERGVVETFALGSRPKVQERMESTEKLVASEHAAAAVDPRQVRSTAEFDLRMRGATRENAYEDIRLGRFALARRQLDRVVGVDPDDAIAQLYYGDLQRLSAQRSGSAVEKAALERLALERYERATALAPTFAGPYRQLGLLYYQQKDQARAREAFARYLALEPDAVDALRIREYLVELGP